MEFTNIEDVPEAIKEFYFEELRTENKLNEEGEEVNTYVVQVDRPQAVSWNKVNELVASKGGSQPEVVKVFIDKAIAWGKWEFLQEYLEYLDAKSIADSIEYAEEDEAPDELTAPLYSIPTEYDECCNSLAKMVRNTTQTSFIEVNGYSFNTNMVSMNHLMSAYLAWDELAASNILLENKIKWTLADNTEEYFTQDEIKAVIDAITVRNAVAHYTYLEEKV